MKTHETTNVYPLWVKKDEEFDPKIVYDEYDQSGYDPDGSDLYVASYAERLAYALELQYRASLRKDRKGEGMAAEAARSLMILETEAQVAHEELRERLELLSEQDKLYAEAVQNWTLDELARRAEVRGKDYDQHDDAAYLEMIDVMDTMADQLIEEDEDEALIQLVTTWRDEVAAELTVRSIHEAYQGPFQETSQETRQLAAA